MKKSIAKKMVVLMLMLGMLIQYTPVPIAQAYTAPGFSAYYINVGAGDCILLEQNGKFALIDTGDSTKWGNVENFLDRKGVTELEYVFITHLDPDHADNFSNISTNYKVKNIVYRGLSSTEIDVLNKDRESNSTKYYARYQALINSSAKQITNCYDGKSLSFEDCTIQFYNRKESYITDTAKEMSTRINGDSLIFKIKYGTNTFFFTGDCGFTYLSDKYKGTKTLNANVLKISHHGIKANNVGNNTQIKNNTDLIGLVKPNIAINSSAYDITTSGGIWDGTLDRLNNVGATVYSTSNISSQVSSSDRSNNYIGILVRSDNNKITTYGVYESGSQSVNKAALVNSLK